MFSTRMNVGTHTLSFRSVRQTFGLWQASAGTFGVRALVSSGSAAYNS